MESVNQVLRDHGLTRERAKQYIALSPLYNRKEVSRRLELSEVTIHRYKHAFRAMEREVRLRVMAELLDELYQEVAEE